MRGHVVRHLQYDAPADLGKVRRCFRAISGKFSQDHRLSRWLALAL